MNKIINYLKYNMNDILLISFIAFCYFILNTNSFLQKEIIENFEETTEDDKKQEEENKIIQDMSIICGRYPNGSRCKQLQGQAKQMNIDTGKIQDYNTAMNTRMGKKGNKSRIRIQEGENAKFKRELTEKEKRIQKLSAYQNIVDVYNKILLRNPSPNELGYYSDKIMNEGLQKEKLEDIIVNSKEYKRMTQSQTNLINKDIRRNITENEMYTKVDRLYRNNFNIRADTTTLQHLKEVYVDLDLNEDNLVNYMNSPRYIKYEENRLKNDDQINIEFHTKKLQKLRNKDKKSAQSSDIDNKELSAKEKQEIVSDLRNLKTTTVDKDKQYKMVIERPNIYVLKMGKDGKAALSGEEYKDALSSLTPENVSGKDSNIIIGDDMAKQLASGKEVDINGLTNNGKIDSNEKKNDSCYRSATDLAKYYNNRNLLKCEKTKKYYFKKDDMVLDRSNKWGVPEKRAPACYPLQKCNAGPVNSQTGLIGTPIGDAVNTEVGSMLPKFDYKEYISA